MYKSILLLIFLGIYIPLSYTEPIKGVKGELGVSPKKNNDNAEEFIDFWDFDPHDESVSDQTSSSNNVAHRENIVPFKETKKSKVKNDKGTFDELQQIVKNIEQTLAKLGKPQTEEKKPVGSSQTGSVNVAPPVFNAIRFLQTDGEIIPNEEEQIGNNNGNENDKESEAENNENESSIVVDDGNDQNEGDNDQDESNNNEVDKDEENQENQENEQGDEEKPEEGNTGTEENEEQDEGGNGGQNGGDGTEDNNGNQTPVEIQKGGMGTVTFSAFIEYDMSYDAFDQENGRTRFINALAGVLEVEQPLIRILNIRRGSVIFDFEITITINSIATRDIAVNRMKNFDDRIKAALISDSLRIFDSAPITNYQRKIVAFAPITERNEPSGLGYIVALVVVLSAMFLGSIIWFIYNQKKYDKEQKLVSRQIKYKDVPSAGAQKVDFESGVEPGANENQIENSGDSVRFYPVSPSPEISLEMSVRGKGTSPKLKPKKNSTPSKLKVN